MTPEQEHLIKINTLRDVQVKCKEAELDGMIIPEIVYEIIKNLEDNYNEQK